MHLMKKSPERVFDRIHIPRHVPNQRRYLMAPLIEAAPTKPRDYRYWNAAAPYLDQGSDGACVGFGAANYANAGPVISCSPKLGNIDAFQIYRRAQKHDEWPGENYSGSSVNGGALALREMGLITEFRWTWDLGELIQALLHLGPLMFGSDWYAGMMKPSFMTGMVHASGNIEGGHAFLLTGVNVKKRVVKFKNSWGKAWGLNGSAYIGFDDMAKLLNDYGEACIATEVPFKKTP